MPDADLLEWADAQPRTGAFVVSPNVTTEGVPAVGWYHGFLEVGQSGRRLTLTESAGSNRTWINVTSSNQWTGWKLQALATPPREYDLPLADGITGYAKYSKDQFGQVLITLQEIQKSDGSKLGNINIETLGALPVGYRPCRGINTAAVATNIEGVPIHGIYQLWIDESGAVKCYGQDGVEATMLRGILIFQAQG